MKSYKTVLLIMALAFIGAGNLYAQSNRECAIYTIAKPAQKTRGKNAKIKVNYKAGQIKVLPAKKAVTRGKAKNNACMFSLYNYNSQMVHVYVDSVYMGSLQPNRVGVVEGVARYSKVYCVSDDQSFNWEEIGDCNCTHIFHLRIKENEGEVYEHDK